MGIVGLGKMGEFHAQWIQSNDELELVAVCDKNPDRLEFARTEYGVTIYNDFGDFLTADLDFVVIVTTNDSHEKLCVAALESNKSVVVEKPMAINHASALRMVAAADRTKQQLFVHQSSRWDRDYLLVKQVMQSGTLGEILQVQSRVMLCDDGWPSWGIDGMANPWRVKEQYGGGMLLDWGPHLIDQVLLMFADLPDGVFGSTQSGIWSKEVDDHFAAHLDFGTVQVLVEASNNGLITLPRWYVIGTGGTMIVHGSSEPFWDTAEITSNSQAGGPVTTTHKLHDIGESGMDGGFYRDLVPYLEGRLETFVDKNETARVVAVLDAIKTSSETREYVTF